MITSLKDHLQLVGLSEGDRDQYRDTVRQSSSVTSIKHHHSITASLQMSPEYLIESQPDKANGSQEKVILGRS